MATNLWTSDRRLYLNAEGAVVEANDPTRQSLLVGVGGSILLSEAERLGLATPPEPKAPSPIKEPKPNKATTPTVTKG